MSGRTAKAARKVAYGDRDPNDRKYRLSYNRHGKLVGKFVMVEDKPRLVVPTIQADPIRQAYQERKRKK